MHQYTYLRGPIEGARTVCSLREKHDGLPLQTERAGSVRALMEPNYEITPPSGAEVRQPTAFEPSYPPSRDQLPGRKDTSCLATLSPSAINISRPQRSSHSAE